MWFNFTFQRFHSLLSFKNDVFCSLSLKIILKHRLFSHRKIESFQVEKLLHMNLVKCCDIPHFNYILKEKFINIFKETRKIL